ncbi:MAG: ATP-dependent zinc protease [Planctomycetaceae bacterium]|nr:ATP-dependent zinc protease [Planctomycetaceae bacterium]
MKPRPSAGKRVLPLIGWREWVQLPEFRIEAIKAKVDSGAKTSTLHAFDLEYFEQSGTTWTRFSIHPWQRRDTPSCIAEAEVTDFRLVRSSNGSLERRPVVRTSVILMGQTLSIELTLTNRDQMGFRMLLGRQAIRNRFVIDAGRSFYSMTLPEPGCSAKRLNP